MDTSAENISLWPHLLPVIIILASFVIGFIIKWTVIKKLSEFALKSKSKIDDILIRSLRSVIVVWMTLVGVQISINVAPLSPKDVNLLEKIFLSLLIFSIFRFLMRLLGEIFLVYSAKLNARLPAASIIKNAFKIFILSIGILIIFQTLGISITPIITTLGIGGLAVALALQDTLANLFSGFHIVATKRVKPGDYVKLDSGQEGYVVDVTWRDTVLRQLPNNYVIIPNSKLSSAVIVNYYRPQKLMNVLIEVGVDYSSDLEKVETVTVEVAREISQQVPGGDKTFEPFVRFHAFADSSINLTVYLRCKEYFDKFLLQHEFIKSLKKRYDQEGINIPFPIRTLIHKKGD